MLTADKRGLAIFENFRVDFDLPKFKAKKMTTSDLDAQKRMLAQVITREAESMEDEVSEAPSLVSWDNGSVIMGSNSFTVMAVNGESELLKKPWWAFWKKAPKAEAEQTEALSVEEFFHEVKGSVQEVSIVQERAKGYEEALKKAKAAGQKALVEKLMAGLNAHRMEAHLVSIGMVHYLDESALVRFYKQSKRGLKLDWVSNFARSIPSSVVERKIKADALGIFDNYAVLHYDPTGKSFIETEAEKAERLRPKDPILFGLIKGRTQLYVVGDWIDEECDLTLDQVADEIGRAFIHKMGDLPMETYR